MLNIFLCRGIVQAVLQDESVEPKGGLLKDKLQQRLIYNSLKISEDEESRETATKNLSLDTLVFKPLCFFL